MRITIAAVGKIKEKYLTMGIAEFTKRLGPLCKLSIIEVDEEKLPDRPSDAERAQALVKEGERLLKQVRDNSYCIVLDVFGQNLSSEELSAHIDRCALDGKSDIVFLIGGAFGLAPQLRQRANLKLSFSRMTFTHQMVRLLLVEQVYRAYKISRGEPYHW